METVIIPGREIRSEMDLHRILASALDFGPYYGKNLNALWDRLTTDVERPFQIIWTDAAQSRRNLGEGPYATIISLLRDVEADDIKRARIERFVFTLHE